MATESEARLCMRAKNWLCLYAALYTAIRNYSSRYRARCRFWLADAPRDAMNEILSRWSTGKFKGIMLRLGKLKKSSEILATLQIKVPIHSKGWAKWKKGTTRCQRACQPDHRHVNHEPQRPFKPVVKAPRLKFLNERAASWKCETRTVVEQAVWVEPCIYDCINFESFKCAHSIL